VHSRGRPEGGGCVTVPEEADIAIEVQGLRIRRHLDSGEPGGPGDHDDVVHQRAAHPLPHPLRGHEQVVEFQDVVRRGDRDEPDGGAVGRDGDLGTARGDVDVTEQQGLGMGQQVGPVTGVRQARLPEDPLQRPTVVGDGGAHLPGGHRTNGTRTERLRAAANGGERVGRGCR
jgi:hypothetical protein